MTTSLQEIRRIIVVQTWGIGDMIMTTPMLRALRKRLPAAEITLIAGARRSADVVSVGAGEMCDRVYTVGSGRARMLRLAQLLLSLRKTRPDAAFLATGMSHRVAQGLRLLMGVPIVSGCASSRPRWGFTHWVPHDLKRHRILINHDIVRAVFPDIGDPDGTSFHVSDAAHREAESVLDRWGFGDSPFIGFHPGSSPKEGIAKRIPSELSVRLLRTLLECHPQLRVVVFIGPDEMELLPPFAAIADSRVVTATGLGLSAIAALLRRAKALIAADSGLGHIAAAVGTPVVTLFGPTIPDRIRPWERNAIVVRAGDAVSPPCRPCYDTPLYGNCPYDQKCMTAIQAQDVLIALEKTCDVR
jgi:ADP-heptose:LPS heptosyltransferase